MVVLSIGCIVAAVAVDAEAFVDNTDTEAWVVVVVVVDLVVDNADTVNLKSDYYYLIVAAVAAVVDNCSVALADDAVAQIALSIALSSSADDDGIVQHSIAAGEEEEGTRIPYYLLVWLHY